MTNVNSVGWQSALESLLQMAFSSEPVEQTQNSNNTQQRKQNNVGYTNSSNASNKVESPDQSFDFMQILSDYTRQRTESTLSDIKDRVLVDLGINRGVDGTRQGLLSGVTDYLADSKVGRFFGITTSSKITGTESVPGSTTASLGATIINAGVGIYDYIRNYGQMDPKTRVVSGMTLGASIGAYFGPIGAGVGAVIGGLAGLFKTSGKPKEQKERDQMRKMLQQANIIDNKFTIGLADGSRFDIGIDGKARAEWGGRKYFEPDPSDPLAQKTFQVFQQITSQLMGGNQNMASSLAGYLTKAALSNANGDAKIVQDNIKALMAQLMGAANQ
jgi:hypothetical protein